MTGAEIRTARKRLGWSQSRLAEALGVTRNTVARWELGELRVERPEMLRLALERLTRKYGESKNEAGRLVPGRR